MNLSLTKNLLLKLTTAAESVATKNPNLPIVSNILIQGKDKKLIVSATDLEVGLVISTPLSVKKEGDALVDPRTFNSLVNYSPEDVVTLEKVDNKLCIQQKNYEASIQMEDLSNFPIIPQTNKDDIISIPVASLVSGLKQVENSAALTSHKIELTGVLLKFNKGELCFVSTDGYRLSEKKISQKSITQDNSQQVIIPIKVVNILLKVLLDKNGDVDIYTEEEQIFFKYQEDGTTTLIFSNIIKGDFPNYNAIIPKDFITTINISSKDFTDKIRAASVFSSTAVRHINIEVQKNSLIITSKEQGKGDFKTSLDVEKQGQDVSFSFNYQYLLDGVSNTNTNNVILKVSKEDGPLFIQGHDSKDYFYLLMPIRE